MRSRGWLLGAVGIALVAIAALLVTQFGTKPNPGQRVDVHLVYRLVDVPSDTTLDQARNAAVEVVTRRLAAYGFPAGVSAGLATDPIDVRVAHADPAQISGIIEHDGRRFSLWRWQPGQPDLTKLGQLRPADANRHPGYRPVFTGLDGTMIRRATARGTGNVDGRSDVVVFLNSRSMQLLDEVTKDLVARPQNAIDNRVAIFIDDQLFEDANVLMELSSGELLLIPSGSFASVADAQRLADDLNAGTVPGRLVRATPGGQGAVTPILPSPASGGGDSTF
jgi:preprotein translocase subunit SecD